MKNKAYTLIELSISLSILAIISIGILGVFLKKNEAKNYIETKNKMRVIEKAIADFVDNNSYLPCPAQGDLIETNTSFGYSVTTYSTLYNSNDACNLVNNGGTSTNYVGMVPVRTLNISDSYAYDGWGRKFSFSIATGMNNSSYIPGVSNNMYINAGNYNGDIKIIDLQGINKTQIDKFPPNNFGAAYVLVSFGQNGLGAWGKNSTNVPNLPASTSREYQNANYTQDRKFIQNERNYLFGHIVAFKTLSDLINIKYQQSPIRIPNLTCTNAIQILNDPNKSSAIEYLPTNVAGSGAELTSTQVNQIYSTANAIQNLCNNQPTNSPDSSSACVFTPDSLSTTGSYTNSLKLWYDGSDPNNGSIPSNGTSITTWYDKSGNGSNATGGNATYTSNTTFQRGALYFSGNSFTANFSFINNASFTYFIVKTAYPTSTPHSRALKTSSSISSVTTNQGAIYVQYSEISASGGNSTIYIPVQEQPLYASPQQSQYMPYVISETFDNPNTTRVLNIRSNNGYAATSTFSSLSYSMSGGSGLIGNDGYNSYLGYIGEIIFYNRVLTIYEQKQVEGYLLRRWFSGEC